MTQTLENHETIQYWYIAGLKGKSWENNFEKKVGSAYLWKAREESAKISRTSFSDDT